MIAVVADDITGAAEMAGIAVTHGLRTVMITDRVEKVPECDVLVMATDSRSMDVQAAADVMSAVGRWLEQKAPDAIIFKKVDSALRGHVVAESAALLNATKYTDAIFLPANPSKGRIVRDGEYLIHGVSISHTDFSFDPEFPAFTSSMTERFPDAADYGIIMPDAETEDDITRIVVGAGRGTLLAGAADLFGALLHSLGYSQTDRPQISFSGSSAIVVCGSTQSQPHGVGLHVAEMPLALYEGRCDAALWIEELKKEYRENLSVVLAVTHKHLTGKDVAVRIRHAMAAAVKALVEERKPAELVIEGGATAWCCLLQLGWRRLDIIGEAAPGVVTVMSEAGVRVTLKPGSYPWGHFFG